MNQTKSHAKPQLASPAAPSRRKVIKSLTWAAPAIIATASLRARAQTSSCAPPPQPCAPETCRPNF